MAQEQTPKVRLSRDHQTYIPLAALIRDAAKKLEHVSMISAGVIEAGVRPGERHVKIRDQHGCVLLIVRGNNAVQEMRIYSRKVAETKVELARLIRNMGIRIRFRP